jgi:hypothetical protein
MNLGEIHRTNSPRRHGGVPEPLCRSSNWGGELNRQVAKTPRENEENRTQRRRGKRGEIQLIQRRVPRIAEHAPVFPLFPTSAPQRLCVRFKSPLSLGVLASWRLGGSILPPHASDDDSIARDGRPKVPPCLRGDLSKSSIPVLRHFHFGFEDVRRGKGGGGGGLFGRLLFFLEELLLHRLFPSARAQAAELHAAGA